MLFFTLAGMDVSYYINIPLVYLTLTFLAYHTSVCVCTDADNVF